LNCSTSRIASALCTALATLTLSTSLSRVYSVVKGSCFIFHRRSVVNASGCTMFLPSSDFDHCSQENLLVRISDTGNSLLITRNYGESKKYRKLSFLIADRAGAAFHGLFSEECNPPLRIGCTVSSCTGDRCTRWIPCATLAGGFNSRPPVG